MKLIKTSNKEWFEIAIKAYSDKETFRLIDDAELGLTERDLRSAVDLIKAARQRKEVTWKEVSGVLIGLGISAAGVWMVAAAIADPEPTSKLGLLVGGGIVIAMTGGLSALRSIGVKFKVKGKALGNEFEIEPK